MVGFYYREGKPEEVARLAEELGVGLVVAGDRKVGSSVRFLSRASRRVSTAPRALRGAGTEGVGPGSPSGPSRPLR